MGAVTNGQPCPVHKAYKVTFILPGVWDCEWSNEMATKGTGHWKLTQTEHSNGCMYNTLDQQFYLLKPEFETSISADKLIKLDTINYYPHVCPRCGGACYIGINNDHAL